MNFFSHGYRYVDQPYFLAGTAVPDWLSYLNRRIRARRKYAEVFVDDVDPQIAAVAQGIVQHHVDDDRFHRSRVFTEMSLDFAVRLRDELPEDESMRPSFLGHILVELLLDSHLHQSMPGRLEAYYQALDSVNPEVVQSAVNRITAAAKTKNPIPRVEKMARLIPRFSAEKFLFDYCDSEKLLVRLNQVMRRVGLGEIPAAVLPFFEIARVEVHERMDELLGSAPL